MRRNVCQWMCAKNYQIWLRRFKDKSKMWAGSAFFGPRCIFFIIASASHQCLHLWFALVTSYWDTDDPVLHSCLSELTATSSKVVYCSTVGSRHYSEQRSSCCFVVSSSVRLSLISCFRSILSSWSLACEKFTKNLTVQYWESLFTKQLVDKISNKHTATKRNELSTDKNTWSWIRI